MMNEVAVYNNGWRLRVVDRMIGFQDGEAKRSCLCEAQVDGGKGTRWDCRDEKTIPNLRRFFFVRNDVI